MNTTAICHSSANNWIVSGFAVNQLFVLFICEFWRLSYYQIDSMIVRLTICGRWIPL